MSRAEPRYPRPASALPPGRLAVGIAIAAGLLAWAGIGDDASAAAKESVVEGELFARISVTVDPDESGTIHVPSPFAVLPGERVAIHVPASGGLFVLQGEDILHHFPYEPDSLLWDLATTGDLLVAGEWHAAGRVTTTLGIFDLRRGTLVDRVRSANPRLRPGLGSENLWRLVADEGTVGVYAPAFAATYPLWAADQGLLASNVQVAAARGGIALAGGPAWVPNPDGSLSRKHHGHADPVTDEFGGEFLDPISTDRAILLQPADVARSDAHGEFLLPRTLGVRLLRADGTARDFDLESVSPNVRAKRVVIHGRPVRVADARLYWIFLGYDFLEIRSAPVPDFSPAGS